MVITTITERPWNEALSLKIAEVQQSFKNIPPKLYFSPSSVRFDGIGVYAAEPLPQGIITYNHNVMYLYTLHLNHTIILTATYAIAACYLNYRDHVRTILWKAGNSYQQ